jgi:hypothetical protein
VLLATAAVTDAVREATMPDSVPAIVPVDNTEFELLSVAVPEVMRVPPIIEPVEVAVAPVNWAEMRAEKRERKRTA